MDDLLYEDVTAMLDLFSRSIPPAQLGRSIYAAQGILRYLGCIFQHAELNRNDQFWGIKNASGQLVAAAHSRTLPGSSHLAYLAVDPVLQGQGLGGRAMDHWEGTAAREGLRTLTLDVAEENHGAHRLYLRRGFQVVHETHEYRLLEPVEPIRDPALLLSGWPMAVASFEVFGFGRFAIQREGWETSVDLIEGYFRVCSADPSLLATLRSMDPERGVLLRTSDTQVASVWSRTGSIFRMHKDLL